MIYSLRFRLLLAFAAVFIVSILIVYFFVSRTAEIQINKVQDLSNEIQSSRIERLLSFYYINNGSWSEVQSTVEQMANAENARIILTDESGVVLGDSNNELTGNIYKTGTKIPIYNSPLPPPPTDVRRPAEQPSKCQHRPRHFQLLANFI